MSGGTFTISFPTREPLPRVWYKPWTWKRRYRMVIATTAPIAYNGDDV